MHAKMKVPGGKVVEVTFDLISGLVQNMSITGDFFVHPEEGIIELEQSLVGHPIDETTLFRLTSTIEYSQLQLIGITAESIVSLMRSAK